MLIVESDSLVDIRQNQFLFGNTTDFEFEISLNKHSKDWSFYSKK